MLQKLGWKQGEGLRPDGIVDPVNKLVVLNLKLTKQIHSNHFPFCRAQQRDSNQGLGAIPPGEMQSGDNEYDAYRKRMMLAYRFRPNPLVRVFRLVETWKDDCVNDNPFLCFRIIREEPTTNMASISDFRELLSLVTFTSDTK